MKGLRKQFIFRRCIVCLYFYHFFLGGGLIKGGCKKGSHCLFSMNTICLPVFVGYFCKLILRIILWIITFKILFTIFHFSMNTIFWLYKKFQFRLLKHHRFINLFLTLATSLSCCMSWPSCYFWCHVTCCFWWRFILMFILHLHHYSSFQTHLLKFVIFGCLNSFVLHIASHSPIEFPSLTVHDHHPLYTLLDRGEIPIWMESEVIMQSIFNSAPQPPCTQTFSFDEHLSERVREKERFIQLTMTLLLFLFVSNLKIRKVTA
jgi:hypothetical protein